eukprot:3585067-Ditylum_brightwellii.AAC.1
MRSLVLSSKAVTFMEDKVTIWELAIGFVCKPTSDSFKATAEMIQSNGGGNIAAKSTEKLSIMSNLDSTYMI